MSTLHDADLCVIVDHVVVIEQEALLLLLLLRRRRLFVSRDAVSPQKRRRYVASARAVLFLTVTSPRETCVSAEKRCHCVVDARSAGRNSRICVI